MRFLPPLTALIVAAVLYGLIMERDSLRSLASTAQAPAAAGDEAVDVPESGDDPVSVVAVTSTARRVENALTLSGRTEAARNVDVMAETTGLVISEPLRRGAVVSRGDVLCRLDPGTREATLAEAKARLLEAQANNRATSQLAERGFAAETAAIGQRATLQSAEAAVEQAEKELERLTMHAPFDGILESDTAEIGSLLQPGSPCATVLSLDPIKLVAYVPEQSVGRIALDSEAAARLITGEEVAGRITFVARSADPLTRTFRVEVEVANRDLSIRDGLTAEIAVGLDGETAHLLPQSVLTLDDAGRLGIRAAVEGRAQFLPVEVIRDDPEGIWLAGLPETLDVIVVGQDFVQDGRAIDVTYREARP